MVDSSPLHAHLLENNAIYWRRTRTTTNTEEEEEEEEEEGLFFEMLSIDLVET